MTWPATHTHRWQDWPPATLLAAKRRAGVSVSVVVPARNEAATVGDLVARLRHALVDSVPLVDELVVVDSDSTDDTGEVARAAGAVVHRAADVRPDLGSFPGKGEALWKSLFVTRGDLLVFLDADLLEWDTHFVTGLLGPLLCQPGVDLVKGSYERPFLGPEAAADEGGRVTELVARPLLALRHPELARLAQPLAGEWAVRRSLLESLTVPTGYGVEVAALLDTAASRGVEAIAQVDLGRRAHRHQSLRDLGAMATQVLAAADARDPARTSPVGPPVAGTRVALWQQHADDGVAPPTREVPIGERPPAALVAAAPSPPGVPAPLRPRAAAVASPGLRTGRA